MTDGKILIVDDEPDNREILKIHLKSMGYPILEAAQGAQAMEFLRSDHFKQEIGLVFCDIRMPECNGIEVLDYFSQEAPWIPMVMLSGYPDRELESSLLKKGAKKFLVKPVEKQNLLNIAEKYFEIKKEI
ncbi:MAG: response regulator [Nitrospinaceae bacterium]